MPPELDPVAPRASRCHQRSGRVQHDAAQMCTPSASSQSDKEAMEIKSAYECHSTVYVELHHRRLSIHMPPELECLSL